MPTITLTTTNASPQTWTVPADAPAGTALTVECWGAGSGGSGSSTSFRAGGAGGSWAKSLYTVVPNDVTNGISYTLSAGTAGTGAANSTVGPDTSFSTNVLNLFSNTVNNGAVVGTPGTLPSPWSYVGNPAGITTSVVGTGFDPVLGMAYIDLRASGTPGSTGDVTLYFQTNVASVASTAFTESVYVAYIPGAGTGLTNIVGGGLQFLDGTSFAQIAAVGFTFTGTMTRQALTGTTGGTNTLCNVNVNIAVTSGAAIDITWRIAGSQFEKAGAASFYKSSPGYTLAKGGGATNGTTGGVGGATAASVGTTAKTAGGGGASRTSGGGGGGGAGKDGAGSTATTATGGTGDAGSGGAAGVSNIEGGGGASASATPSAAGDPGGGGGGNTSTGNGSQGGRGQVRITYSSALIVPQLCPDVDQLQQFLPFMAQ